MVSAVASVEAGLLLWFFYCGALCCNSGGGRGIAGAVVTPALSSPVTFLRRLVCRGFFFFLSPFFRCLVSAPSRCAVLYLRFAACAFPGVQAGMTGSDSDEARHVSQADLATFRQDVANEMAQQMAQLQAALDRAMNDFAATIRAPAPVGGGCAYGSGEVIHRPV